MTEHQIFNSIAEINNTLLKVLFFFFEIFLMLQREDMSFSKQSYHHVITYSGNVLTQFLRTLPLFICWTTNFYI